MIQNNPHVWHAVMPLNVIVIPGFGMRFCCRKVGCKRNHGYPILTLEWEHHFDLLNALGMGMEIRVAKVVPERIGLAAKLYYDYVYRLLH